MPCWLQLITIANWLYPLAILSGLRESIKAEAESVESGGPVVTEADIANIVAQWTGIPIEKASVE